MKRFVLLSLLVGACGTRPPAESPLSPEAPPVRPPGLEVLAPPDRSKLPEPAPSPTWALPTAKTFALANGLKVYHLKQGATPLVAMLLVLPRGAATDPKDKSGLTALTTDLLDEGAGGKSALELSEELQRLGTDYGGGTDVDQITLAMNTIAGSFAPSVELLADIVRRPELSNAEFSRRKQQRIAEAIASESEPTHGRAVVLRRALYGDGYGGALPSGTKDSLAKIQLADVKKHYASMFVAEGAAMIVVGGIEEKVVKAVLEKAFGDWTGKAAVSEAPIADPPPSKPIYFINYPDASQSAIAVARRAPGETTEEYFPAMVFSRAFGEAFTSRVNLNLREDKGYTYGARSSFSRWNKAGFFATAASVKREVTRESLSEVMKELDDVCRERPLTAQERDDAVNGLLLGYPGRFERNNDVASQLATLPVHGRPGDWFEKWPTNVKAVDLAAANAIAKRYCGKDDVVVVVAGDRKVVEPTLAELGRPVVHYDPRGNKTR